VVESASTHPADRVSSHDQDEPRPYDLSAGVYHGCCKCGKAQLDACVLLSFVSTRTYIPGQELMWNSGYGFNAAADAGALWECASRPEIFRTMTLHWYQNATPTSTTTWDSDSNVIGMAINGWVFPPPAPRTINSTTLFTMTVGITTASPEPVTPPKNPIPNHLRGGAIGGALAGFILLALFIGCVVNRYRKRKRMSARTPATGASPVAAVNAVAQEPPDDGLTRRIATLEFENKDGNSGSSGNTEQPQTRVERPTNVDGNTTNLDGIAEEGLACGPEK
jgi:hypothetical protein